MAEANSANDHSTLWGYSVEFWDRFGIWSLVVGAMLGVAALLLTAASAYVLYRVADEAQKALEETSKSSGERIADLNRDTARLSGEAEKARAEAAQANARALEAKLELEKFKAPRTLNLEQQRLIADRIRQFSGTNFDAAVISGDPEALSILEMIEAAVRAADWTQIDWKDTRAAILLGRSGLPTVGNVSIAGILIQVESDQRQLDDAATALAIALREQGLSVMHTRNFQPIAAANTTAIHILVGRKD